MKKKIKFRIEYILFRIFIICVKISPLSFKFFFKKTTIFIFRFAGKRYEKLVNSNITIAFPEINKTEKEILKNKIYKHFASVLVDIVYLFGGKDPEKVVGKIRVEGLESIKNVLKKGKGAVLFSAHFGNWELIPYILNKKTGVRLNSIARKMDNPLTEKIVKKFRNLMGSEIVYKDGSLRKMLRIFNSNGIIYLLVDQNTITREGVPVSFFGREVIAVTTIAQLSLKKGVPVIPLFLTYENDGKVLRIGNELDFEKSGDYDRDILKLTQNTMSMIEENIKKRPEQWFWFHDRWRRRSGQKRSEDEEERKE